MVKTRLGHENYSYHDVSRNIYPRRRYARHLHQRTSNYRLHSCHGRPCKQHQNRRGGSGTQGTSKDKQGCHYDYSRERKRLPAQNKVSFHLPGGRMTLAISCRPDLEANLQSLFLIPRPQNVSIMNLCPDSRLQSWPKYLAKYLLNIRRQKLGMTSLIVRLTFVRLKSVFNTHCFLSYIDEFGPRYRPSFRITLTMAIFAAILCMAF